MRREIVKLVRRKKLTISVCPSLQPAWNFACLSWAGRSLYRVYRTCREEGREGGREVERERMV